MPECHGNTVNRASGEEWQAFVRRCGAETLAYLQSFNPAEIKKVKGIASIAALARIDSLQPYIGGDHLLHPLWLIHDMDRIDKHRELVLVVHSVGIKLTAEGFTQVATQQYAFEIRSRIVGPIGPTR